MVDPNPGEYRPQLISALDTAAWVKGKLELGNEDAAIRWLSEAVSRLLHTPVGSVVPAAIAAEPASTGSLRHDTLLATAFAYALDTLGAEIPEWTDKPALDTEWLWGDDDAAEEFRAYIRAQTPPLFLSRNILCRDRDFRSV
jgi:hypothetical protein